MAKAKVNLGDLTNRVYGLLHALEGEERSKVLNSVYHLFGETIPSGVGSAATHDGLANSGHSGKGALPKGNEKGYFAQKNPATNGGVALNKGEMLAVAARYREQNAQGDIHSRDDFANFFQAARVNFDKKSFSADLRNAQRQAKLFNTGGVRGAYQLSYYGQHYVDALPDRDAVKAIKRPGRKKVSKNVTKKGS